MNNYSIQVVSRMTGIGIHTLRAWERRYQAVVPARLDNGRRAYSEVDVEKLQLLAELTRFGHSISDIANHDIEKLKNVLEQVSSSINNIESSSNDASDKTIDSEFSRSAEEIVQHIVMAISGYKLDIVSHELHKLRYLTEPKVLVFDILIPLIRDIGLRVDRKELSIAQEHALTSILKSHIGTYLYQSYESKKHAKNVKVLFATPQGDLHEFGIQLAAMLAVEHDLEFYVLGPNLPAQSLIEASVGLNADIIILGTTGSTQSPSAYELNKYFDDILINLGARQQLWVGGTGVYDYDAYKDVPNFKAILSLEQLNEELTIV